MDHDALLDDMSMTDSDGEDIVNRQLHELENMLVFLFGAAAKWKIPPSNWKVWYGT